MKLRYDAFWLKLGNYHRKTELWHLHDFENDVVLVP